MKQILDPCCGSKMFYFPETDMQRIMFCDNREFETKLCDGRILRVAPDVICDFRQMPFKDNQFKLIIFDPPHLNNIGDNAWMAKKYGKLPKDFVSYLKQGFDECWRVLDNGGTLVFKWNENQIKLNQIMETFPDAPVMGTRVKSDTMFIVFFKS